jgi:hypothetical protein
MATLKTSLSLNSSFYPSAKAAMQAAPEKLACLNFAAEPSRVMGPRMLAVADVDPRLHHVWADRKHDQRGRSWG